MTKWVLKGMRTGIVTTDYPDRDEAAPGVSPGRPSTAVDESSLLNRQVSHSDAHS